MGESSEPRQRCFHCFRMGCGGLWRNVGWGVIPQYPVRDKAKSRGTKGAGLVVLREGRHFMMLSSCQRSFLLLKYFSNQQKRVIYRKIYINGEKGDSRNCFSCQLC